MNCIHKRTNLSDPSSVRACAHTRKQLAAEMRLSWLDDDAKVWKDRQEGIRRIGTEAKRDKRTDLLAFNCSLLLYFLFVTGWGSARGSSGFDGHVSLLVLIGLSYSGQCVLIRKFCDRMVMMIIEYLVIKNKKKLWLLKKLIKR